MVEENVNSTKTRLEGIMEKFNHLKSIDKNYKIFGAEVHRYGFGKTLEVDYFLDFEKSIM